MTCSCFDDLDNKRIGENEVLFFNWQSINKKDNVYIRENEQDNNLTSVVANTRAEGREIILVIDESHHTAESEKSRELIEAITSGREGTPQSCCGGESALHLRSCS